MAGVPQRDSSKTFYLETFGCQMNVHDSEKVIGTLLHEGYRQVETVEEADLILYNTCSIRDKAEQKVFHRLADYKKLQAQGKTFGVLGCVAQQEGEKIFERAPHVSLVCGSASYRKLPEMLVQLEAGQLEAERIAAVQREAEILEAGKARDSRLVARDSLVRITGLDDRQTDECFETEFTARTNPYRGYITIIEGCDKFCSYCVVPYTRGKERSRTAASVLAEARQMADLGYSEIQLLGQNVNSYKDPTSDLRKKKTFAELLAAVGEVPGIRRVRFTTSHPRDFGRDIVHAIDAVPTLCDHVHLPVQSGSTRVLDAMQRLYNREQYLERIAWIKAAKRDISITSDMIVGFPGETEADFDESLSLLDEVGYDSVFTFKYSPRPNTPSLTLEDAIPDEEKARRLEVVMARQRDIQIARYKNYIGASVEVMVEGYNEARRQWVGRTSQNKTLNFVAGDGDEVTRGLESEAKTGPESTSKAAGKSARSTPARSTAEQCGLRVGGYAFVRVTSSFPNSLVGELVV
jgi:tRNA-2-methylthio-N6-dimethylallyladenosine synthase